MKSKFGNPVFLFALMGLGAGIGLDLGGNSAFAQDPRAERQGGGILWTEKFDPRARGAGSSGGAELAMIPQYNAWFVNPDARPDPVVSYCLRVGSQFGVTQEGASKAVADALAQWKEFLQKLEPGSQGWTLEIATQFRDLGDRCESGKADLSFYLGEYPSALQSIVERYPSSVSIAYAEPKAADQIWSKGYVFVKNPKVPTTREEWEQVILGSQPGVPDWSFANNLHSILLHEVGHVFGTGHLPRSIMDEGIAWRLLLESRPLWGESGESVLEALKIEPRFKNRIEHEYDLVPFHPHNHAHVEGEGTGASATDGYLLDQSKVSEFTLSRKSPDGALLPVGTFIRQGYSLLQNTDHARLTQPGRGLLFNRVIYDRESEFWLGSEIHFEQLQIMGTFKVGNESFAAIYQKNMPYMIGDTLYYPSHLLQIFRDGKWEVIFTTAKLR